MTTTTTAPMSGATLKTRLGGLGLPPSWFADRMNVTMRTVVRWFDGDVVPSTAAEEVERIADKTLDEMRKILDQVGDDDPAVLRTYRTDEEFVNKLDYPASWHRALTFRILEHLEAQGHNVTVEYR